MPSTRRDFLAGSLAAGLGAAASAKAAEDTVKPSAQVGELAFSRGIPVRYETDVFVAGGGPAGVAAALAAARQGASVFLAERNTCLGGMGTAGMLPLFMPFGDGVNFLALICAICKAQFTKVLPYYGFDRNSVGGVHQLVSTAIKLD